jgi:hypothetical protein
MGKLFLMCSVLFLFGSCQKEAELIVKKKVFAQADVHKEDTIMKEGNRYFSRLYKENSMGLIGEFIVPDSLKEKELIVTFYGKARTNYAFSNASIRVAVISEDKEVLGWPVFNLRQQFTENNEWCYFRDSVSLIHQSWQKPYHYIDVAALLGNSTHEQFDIDTLFFDIKAKERE